MRSVNATAQLVITLALFSAPGCMFNRGDRVDQETAMKWFLAGGESRPTGVVTPLYDWKLGALAFPIHSVKGPRLTLEELAEIRRQLEERIAGLEAGYFGEIVPRDASAEFKAGHVAAGRFFALPFGRLNAPKPRSAPEPESEAIAEPIPEPVPARGTAL